MSFLDGLNVQVRLESELLPSITLGVVGGGGAPDGFFKKLVLKVVKPRAVVVVSGADVTSVAPAGNPEPGAAFPLLLAAAAVGPALIFAAGWAAARVWGGRRS